MVFEQIEQLKNEWTDKYVVVDASRPELTRFDQMVGHVKTVNMSGRALVEFDKFKNIGWYDIDLSVLKVVDKPVEEAKPAKSAAKPAAGTAKPSGAKPTRAKAGGKPSTADILAAARAKKGAAPTKPASGKAVGKKPSTADILAAARGKKSSPTEPASAKPIVSKSAGGKPAGGKLSTADILAAARGKKAGTSPPKQAATAKQTAANTTSAKPAAGKPPRGKLSTADILAAARGEKAEAVTPEPGVSEPSISAPAVDKGGAQAKQAVGDVPTDTAGKIAWCKEHDAS